MANSTVKRGTQKEHKIISVSVKRQITIPQKFFDALGFNTEAECVLQDDGVLIKPLREDGGGEFSEQILADLISQGFQGQELLDKFKEQSRKIRPAVRKMLEEADELVRSGGGKVSINELFGPEE